MGKRKREGQRPQPAGWDKAVKPSLKPEHVKRVSDTEMHITLPPSPNYDIEEDETVHDWIPPELLVKTDRPTRLAPLTIGAVTYEERIENAIRGLKEEQTSDGAVATFLLTFFTCEIVANSIIGCSNAEGTGRKSLKKKHDTKNVSDALKKLKINFDQKAVDILFSTGKALASEMSARQLRDDVVHRMKPQHRSAVRARYASLMGTMMEFLSAVEGWRTRSRGGEAES